MCYCILLHHFIVFAVDFISCVTPLVCMLMLWLAFVRLIKETAYLLTYQTPPLHRNAARGRPSHGHIGSAQKFCEDRPSGSRDMLADRQTHTDRQTDRNTPFPYRGGVIISPSVLTTRYARTAILASSDGATLLQSSAKAVQKQCKFVAMKGGNYQLPVALAVFLETRRLTAHDSAALTQYNQ